MEDWACRVLNGLKSYPRVAETSRSCTFTGVNQIQDELFLNKTHFLLKWPKDDGVWLYFLLVVVQKSSRKKKNAVKYCWWIWHINIIEKHDVISTLSEPNVNIRHFFSYLYALNLNGYLIKVGVWGRWCFLLDHVAIIRHAGFQEFTMICSLRVEPLIMTICQLCIWQ